MIKIFHSILPALILTVLTVVAFFPCNALALQLSKSISHYADEMEFYYLKPRSEIIPGLLHSLSKNGQLAKGENRLMLAAFLSELLRVNALDFGMLRKEAKSRDEIRVLAWSAHLAQNSQEKNLLTEMEQGGDTILTRQIAESPAPLEKWNPLSEKTSLQMYWGAFMASGKQVWLDAIINCALDYARAAERGAKSDPAYAVGSVAAASLFEFAPRHKAIRDRLKYFMKVKSRVERDMISIILENCQK